MKTRVALLVALAAASLSGNAIGCGDSLYRVGKGISYRVYSAPLPGNLLIYAPTEGAAQLAEALAQSGHDVHLVGSVDDLRAELAGGGYDVVIAPFSEAAAIESASTGAAGARASFLPVAFSEADEQAAKQAYGRAMVPDHDEIKHYLKAIHKALKSRSG